MHFILIYYVCDFIVVGSALVTVNCKAIVLLQLNSSYGKINWSESDVLNVNKYRHCAILSEFVNIMVYVIMKSCRTESVVSSWQQLYKIITASHVIFLDGIFRMNWKSIQKFVTFTLRAISWLLHNTLHHLDARVRHNNRLRYLYWKPSKFKEEAWGNLLLARISVRLTITPYSKIS